MQGVQSSQHLFRIWQNSQYQIDIKSPTLEQGTAYQASSQGRLPPTALIPAINRVSWDLQVTEYSTHDLLAR